MDISDTESENFESADEDVENDDSNEPSISEQSSVKQNEIKNTQNVNNTVCPDDRNTLQPGLNLSEEITTLEDVDAPLTSDITNHKIVKKDNPCKVYSSDLENSNTEKIKHNISDSNVNQIKISTETKQSHSEALETLNTQTIPDFDNKTDTKSGWDFEEWENTEEKPDNKLEINKTESIEDGWDNDFDDWEIDEVNTKKMEDTKSEQPQNKDSVTNLFEKLTFSAKTDNKDSNSWSSWGSWGVSSLLSTASDSVQTFTNQVSQGLTTVLESGMGVPSPEELARIQALENEKRGDKVEKINENSGRFGFTNLITGVTKLVETTGSKVVHTSLDTLEVIGKKTMEVLQEGDPGLIKKRALFGLNNDKPVLSQILREAKEKAEFEDKNINTVSVVKKIHFEMLFDDHQGLVHLEALEMLSKQCDLKLNSLIETLEGDELNELQETMLQVKELCELPDEEEDDQIDIKSVKSKIETSIEELGVQISYDKLLKIWEETEIELNCLKNENAVHERAIDTLAQLTSAAVEQLHKAAELLLIKERRSTADEADSLVQLTTVISAVIGMVAAKFSEKLDTLALENNNPDVNSLITNIFLEASNSSSYIQDAFQLLVPVLQVGAV